MPGDKHRECLGQTLNPTWGFSLPMSSHVGLSLQGQLSWSCQCPFPLWPQKKEGHRREHSKDADPPLVKRGPWCHTQMRSANVPLEAAQRCKEMLNVSGV